MKLKMASLFIFALGPIVALAQGGSMVGGGDAAACSQQSAIAKAQVIADTIGTANQQDLSNRWLGSIQEDSSFFRIPVSYDQGLSVPTYTVEILKSNCHILNVKYSNNEG